MSPIPDDRLADPTHREELQTLQREVQRMLGRCLLRLQQYEKLMKAIVAHHEISASGSPPDRTEAEAHCGYRKQDSGYVGWPTARNVCHQRRPRRGRRTRCARQHHLVQDEDELADVCRGFRYDAKRSGRNWFCCGTTWCTTLSTSTTFGVWTDAVVRKVQPRPTVASINTLSNWEAGRTHGSGPSSGGGVCHPMPSAIW